ncbi:MAG: aldehyde ferredoxin oxidoreductase family protein [Pirellulales bacterium]
MFAYHGRYLRIDLTRRDARFLPLGDDVLRRFVGGSGLGAWLLLAEGRAAADALAAESPLVFCFSPLVGSPLTTSAKFAVVSKSPLTERINDSLASSGFALAGKRTGADALVIVGRAREPSVLVIDDGRVSIEPAADVWGLDTQVAEATLRERLHQGSDQRSVQRNVTGNMDRFELAAIGPAGERLVRYATISHDGRHAGRGGSGAVMGSKLLKAIAVRGTQRTAWADPTALSALAKDLSARSFGPATAKYRELGTAANLLVFNRLNVLPTRNFQQGSFAAAENLAPETLAVARQKTRASCACCTIGCEHLYGMKRRAAEVDSVAAGESAQADRPVRVEYESLFALGSLCGIADADAVLSATARCDELGIDTISTGGTIAFAMECAERGLLDAPWLRFGDASALGRAIESIAARDCLGDAMAEGSRRLAAKIGGGSIDFAPQVKGLEIPGYEPRGLQTMALGFAVGSRGADHNRSGAYEADFSQNVDRRRPGPGAAALAIDTEDRAALLDSLILCKFLRGALDDFHADAARMLHLATGWDISAAELRAVAKRIVAAKKLFNIRAGWTPAEDTLPRRFLAEHVGGDAAATLPSERLADMVRGYNLGRGWSSDGQLSDEQIGEFDRLLSAQPGVSSRVDHHSTSYRLPVAHEH